MICRMNEWQFYDKADKHQIAYTQLARERSQNMIKLLGFKDKDATTVDACLRCHAVPEIGGVRMNVGFLSEGVTCVACHGAYREWVGEHPDAVVLRGLQSPAKRPKDTLKDWLDFTRKEKEELKGMTDLWDPVRRVEICASCHVGSFKEKKVITHAMYAAGHPPLPSFEPATFSEFQPRHWQYLREKAPHRQARLQPFDHTDLEHAELAAISGPILLRESMRLFADEAKANRDDPAGAAWPDFARYDCRACHHELKSDTNGQDRGGPTALGRPGEPKWTHALTRLGISILTATAEDAARERSRYESLVKAFQVAMRAEPFGNKGRLLGAAEDLVNWADKLINNRSRAPVDEKRARKVLAQLCEEAAKTSLDYDGARQVAWAFRAIYHDVIPEDRQKDRDPEIERILSRLDGVLLMKLPSAKEQVPIEESLRARLLVGAQYDAAATMGLFGQLRSRVIRQ
jgi:hypothetical protein